MKRGIVWVVLLVVAACNGTGTGPEASIIPVLSVDGVVFVTGSEVPPDYVAGEQIGVVEEYIFCTDDIQVGETQPCEDPKAGTRIWSNVFPVGTPVYAIQGFATDRFLGVGAAGALDEARAMDVFGVEPEEIRLGPGESAVVDGLTVRFVGVPEDSRCPTGVTCVWEGNATVVLELTEGSTTVTATLESTLGPRTVELGPYAVDLLRVDPYPDQSTLNGIPADWYRVTLLVSKPGG